MAKTNNIDKQSTKKKSEEIKIKPSVKDLIGKKIEDIGTLEDELVLFFNNGYAIRVSGDICLHVEETSKNSNI